MGLQNKWHKKKSPASTGALFSYRYELTAFFTSLLFSSEMAFFATVFLVSIFTLSDCRTAISASTSKRLQTTTIITGIF